VAEEEEQRAVFAQLLAKRRAAQADARDRAVEDVGLEPHATIFAGPRRGDARYARAMRPVLAALVLAASAAAHPAYDIAVDGKGRVYFLDWPKKRLMRVSAGGKSETVADLAKVAKRTDPHTLALDAKGNVLVGASYEPRIWRITPQGAVSEVDLAPWRKALAGGNVLDLEWTEKGLYVTAAHEDPARFRLLDPDGKELLSVRRGEMGYRNLYAGSFCVGKDGTVFFTADERVWKLPKGGKPVVLAGSAEAGLRDGKGGKARFSGPYGIRESKDGALFVADEKNGRIRRVDAAGTVTTLPPKLDGPHAIALGPEGRVLVAEYHRATIRIRRLEGDHAKTLATVRTR